MKKIFISSALLLLITCFDNAKAQMPDTHTLDSIVNNFDYVVGTQTFDPRYQHTNQTMLIETAQAIRDMGSNILKIGLDSRKFEDTKNFNEKNPTDLIKREPSFRKVMDMDFTYYILWVYAPGVNWFDGMTEKEKKLEYDNMKELTKYLLTQYNGTGKEFYLGHWEGDWYLVDNYNSKQTDVDPVKLQGMIDWYNVRQQAVDDAIAETKHENVKVYHYSEIVLVKMDEPSDRIINRVLPYINVDYVSYSSYESLGGTTYEQIDKELKYALNYIANTLPRKPSIKGKRVFIGEYGFPLLRTETPEEQDRLSRYVMRSGLEWGCPFILYWEMYNNEVDNRGQIGFWMIDDKNVKQPIYYTHENFYKEMREWVRNFYVQNKRTPTPEEYKTQAVKFFD